MQQLSITVCLLRDTTPREGWYINASCHCCESSDLGHLEIQQQQFIPLYQEWQRQFQIWKVQLQTYPNKNQLQQHETQWSQWQEQMASTSHHLQERMDALRNVQQQYINSQSQSYTSRGPPPSGPPIPPLPTMGLPPTQRIPPSAPPPSHPPPRVERKPESKNVDDILKMPGRQSRPDRIVVIMRGLPGSGKTHVAKLIRDKEVEYGGAAPRVLSLDDYFMTEVEKVVKDPDSGKRVKKKLLEYEYEPEMEETYRSSMFKTFRKTLDDGFFPFIIIDAINNRVKHFEQFWSAAKTKGFEVYIAEMSADNQTCAKRNIHGRKLKEINKMSDHWDSTPRHMLRLDIRSLLQDAAIEEVEMEDFDPNSEQQQQQQQQEEESKKEAPDEEEYETVGDDLTRNKHGRGC
uniref:YLP motif-containing protein 1 n=1 Tax=Callorhinchus milii TaxID=7868 RepID=A0A4W3IHN5_CALMI